MIADLSFGWPSCSAAVLKPRGITGVIGYCNNADPRKNVSAARLADWLDNGLPVALVWEDDTRDVMRGAAGGDQIGRDFMQQAKAKGYDPATAILFMAADFNTQPGDYDTATAFLQAFRQHVPIGGLYGNAGLIDHTAGAGLIEYGWQSNSTSFSPNGPSVHARLLQRFNDPRVAGLPVDANDIAGNPLLFMGETMALDAATQTQINEIHAWLSRLDFALDPGDAVPWQVRGELTAKIRAAAANAASAASSAAAAAAKPTPATAAAIAGAIAPLINSAGITPAQLAAALVDLAAKGRLSS